MNSLDERRKRRVWLGYSVKLRWACVGLVLGLIGGILIARAGPFVDVSNQQSLDLPEAQAYETEVEVKALVSFCGAEIEATYSGFKIHKEHKVAGKVYRTDTVEGVGKTRVAVCVDAEGYRVEKTETGLKVTVEPTGMRLLLPSVDHWGTQTDYNDGADLIGMLNPLVAENNDLMDVTYMWLQLQATEGACVEAAWEVAVEQLRNSIRSFEAQTGVSRLHIDVEINNEQSLEEAREKVLKEINLSGVRQRQALSLLQSSDRVRVESDSAIETCSVVGEV